ncbi:MAG: hypothetical protein JSW02_10825 [candidate division WOR-3 bacterium]|nr:MAG: hypothetical protein JSW02_10825 [candidate division WOR-3 bacterium]
MTLDNIKQPPLNTSLMGVIRGVMNYYDIKMSDAMVYGGSGHAFIINIHDVVCPSSPYVWKYDGFIKLLQNLGLKMTHLGFFSKENTPDDRKKVEDILRQHLNAKDPCSLLNMDNQIIYGYDEERLLLTQPWGDCVDVTPATLTFQTWKEFGDEVHVEFFSYQKIDAAESAKIVKDSLLYAQDLFMHPEKYSYEKYTIGVAAYDMWIKALEQGTAHAHGNWWNSTVWSECRNMAAEYFAEVAGKYDSIAKQARDLSAQYKEVGELLKQVSDKEKPAEEKIPLLKKAKNKEEAVVTLIENVLQELT